MNEGSRLRAIGELVLLAVTGLLVVWCIQILFFPHALREQPSETLIHPRLRAVQEGPDLFRLNHLLTHTPPAPRDPAWTPPSLSNRWQWITIHHSATLTGNAARMDADHRKRGMENGIGYHFVIGNGTGSGDGEVEVTRRWTEQLQGGHIRAGEGRNGDLNQVAIGICLVGDFTRDIPTGAQIASLKALLNYLVEITRVPASHIRGHRNMPGQATECPGVLPVDMLLRHRQSPER